MFKMHGRRFLSNHMRRRFHAAVVACLTLVCVASGLAPQPVDARDHDRARSAVKRGDVLPLRSVLGPVQRRYGGEVLDARLRGGSNGRPWLYDVKLMRPNGTVIVVTVDARTGKVRGMR